MGQGAGCRGYDLSTRKSTARSDCRRAHCELMPPPSARRPTQSIRVSTLAPTTPGRRQRPNPHSAKRTRGFVQSGFNEVRDTASQPPRACGPHRTLQIHRLGLIVIQAGIWNGDPLGTRLDVGRGMGVSCALHPCCPGPEWTQTHQPSPCSGWDFLDSPHGVAMARHARGVRQVAIGLPPVPTLDPGGFVGAGHGCSERKPDRAGCAPDDRQHGDPRPSSGSGRKRGTPRQGFGRSRGGFTTKIHLRVNGAGLPMRSDITSGQTSDSGLRPGHGRQPARARCPARGPGL